MRGSWCGFYEASVIVLYVWIMSVLSTIVCVLCQTVGIGFLFERPIYGVLVVGMYSIFIALLLFSLGCSSMGSCFIEWHLNILLSIRVMLVECVFNETVVMCFWIALVGIYCSRVL